MLAGFIALLITFFNLLFGGQTAELLFVGDAMQHTAQLEAAKQADSGNYSYSGCFDEISPDVIMADYAIVNLETPIGERNFTGYPCFNAPYAFPKALKDAGFDLFLTANNHTLDRRDRGLKDTCRLLDSLKVDHIGTYPDIDTRDAAIPFIKNICGIKFGFLNYTYGTNGIQPGREVVVDYIQRDKIAEDIRATRDAGAEFIVVAIHWGDEYQLLPNKAQKSLADFLIDNGVDAVIGSHPHVIQPMEMRTRPDGSKALVVYSLGNFISNMRTTDTRGGAMVKMLVTRNSDGRPVLSRVGYDLVYTIPPSYKDKTANFRLVPVEKAVNHPEMGTHARAFLNRASDIFNKHNKDVERLHGK